MRLGTRPRERTKEHGLSPSRWWRPDVLHSQRAHPCVGSVGIASVRPSVTVPDDVIVAAESHQLSFVGDSPIDDSDSMIEITLAGRHSTPWEDAGQVPRLDQPAELSIRPATGDT